MNKQDFPLLTSNPELVYFDNAATTQKPKVVIGKLQDFYTNTNANVHRGIYSLSEAATLAYEQSRSVVANFIGAKPEEIIFTSGATEGLNLLSTYFFSDQLRSGDEIIVSEMEHHSNILPWQRIAKITGAKLLFIDTLPDYTIDLDQLDEFLTSGKVKIVALAHMSNVLGTINPIKQIAKKIRQANPDIKFIVDAAQSISHLPINVTELDCDFLVASGHKLYGPTGIGFIFGKKTLLENSKPFFVGGGMIEKVTKIESTWDSIPSRFEAGTPNIAGAIGLATAIKYIQSLNPIELIATELELSALMYRELESISQIKIFGPSNLGIRGPVFSFKINGIHAHDFAQLMDTKNIAIRAGHHCTQILHRERLQVPATARASLAFYNDTSEVHKFIKAIKEITGSNIFKR